MYITREGKVDYRPEYLNRMLEDALGFNPYNLF
jgi:hypothetical protein